jgi:hypothetical protein
VKKFQTKISRIQHAFFLVLVPSLDPWNGGCMRDDMTLLLVLVLLLFPILFLICSHTIQVCSSLIKHKLNQSGRNQYSDVCMEDTMIESTYVSVFRIGSSSHFICYPGTPSEGNNMSIGHWWCWVSRYADTSWLKWLVKNH